VVAQIQSDHVRGGHFGVDRRVQQHDTLGIACGTASVANSGETVGGGRNDVVLVLLAELEDLFPSHNFNALKFELGCVCFIHGNDVLQCREVLNVGELRKECKLR